MIKRNQILSLLKEQYGIEKPKLTDLKGHVDKVFLVTTARKKFVLKISMNRKMRDVLFQQQLDFIGFLNQWGFSTSSIVKTKDGNESAQIHDYKKRNCVLFENIDGIAYEVKNDDKLDDFCDWFIDIHKNCLKYPKNSELYIHSIIAETDKNNYIIKYAKRYKKQYMQPLLDIQERILSKYRTCLGNLSATMLVNDLHETNIRIHNGQKVILDFNMAGRNYLVDELSWILVWYFIQKNKINKIGSFLELYLKTVFLNKNERSLLKELPILFQSRFQFIDVKDMRKKSIFLNKMEQLTVITKDFQEQIR